MPQFAGQMSIFNTIALRNPTIKLTSTNMHLNHFIIIITFNASICWPNVQIVHFIISHHSPEKSDHCWPDH